jgi:large subunit ribosomal protein L3
VRNLRVERIDTERNLIFIRGAVPGARNSVVMIRKMDS